MSEHDGSESIRVALERSSLGTPEAQAARAAVSDDMARAVVEHSRLNVPDGLGAALQPPRPVSEHDEPIHWIGDAPTSLHGNGAASFARASRDEDEVTCRLCLSLLARGEHRTPSEHDEPETALTRLTDAERTDLKHAYYAWMLQGQEELFDQALTAVVNAHLADVLLAEGYTTSPAPEATETVEWEYALVEPGDTEPYSDVATDLDWLTENGAPIYLTRSHIHQRRAPGPWVPVDRAADEHEEGP